MMNKSWTLSPLARLSLVALILSLGLVAIASQTEQVALVDRFNRAMQVGNSVWHEIEAMSWPLAAHQMVAGGAAVFLIVLVIRLYLPHFSPPSFQQSPRYLELFLLILLFAGSAWLMITTDQEWLVYWFPAATLSILVAVLFDVHLSVLVTALMGLIVGYLAGGSLELTAYGMLGGLMGLLSMRHEKHLDRVRWSGAYVALSNIVVILIFHFPQSHSVDFILKLMLIGIGNGVVTTSLTLIGFFLAGNLLGIATSVQFLDLTQPTHPLLRRLLLHAPGTYHHSLMVSNLAEQAAERIGADALLTGVGAYYHDIGKLQRPYFFTENQLQESDIHDRLDSQTSAQIIISHVTEGLKLAKKYGLPPAVRAFIAEHHGTSRVEYFYHQAREQATEPTQVSEVHFRYPGPKPQSKETALVMLADCCEATVRATNLASVEALDQLIHHLIMDKVNSGQLDECELTLRELKVIHHTFVEVLKGVLHHRIEYPPMIDKAPAATSVVIPSSLQTNGPSAGGPTNAANVVSATEF